MARLASKQINPAQADNKSIMLKLISAKTLQGVASAATALSYLITGVLRDTAGAETVINAQGQLPNAPGVLYTSTGGESSITSICVSNTTANPVTFTLYVGGVAAANQITGTLQIPDNGTATYEAGGWRVLDKNSAPVTG